MNEKPKGPEKYKEPVGGDARKINMLIDCVEWLMRWYSPDSIAPDRPTDLPLVPTVCVNCTHHRLERLPGEVAHECRQGDKPVPIQAHSPLAECEYQEPIESNIVIEPKYCCGPMLTAVRLGILRPPYKGAVSWNHKTVVGSPVEPGFSCRTHCPFCDKEFPKPEYCCCPQTQTARSTPGSIIRVNGFNPLICALCDKEIK